MRTILSFLYRSNRSVCFSAAVLLSMLTVTGALSASTTPQIAAGGYHSIALKSDGTVLVWGYNNYGQLGDGTYTYCKTTPVQVSSLTGVTAISGGEYHTIVLKSDGTVWAWGCNDDGQLGDGTTTQRNAPVQVSSLSGVTAITSGGHHTIVLKSDGTVWAWGYNHYRQLGDGTTTNSTTPVEVGGLSGVTAVAGGGYHTIVLKSDGAVWAWGRNGYGQLGDGTYTDSSTPVQVSGLSGVIAIAGGWGHTIALKSDGTVWAWGWNGSGQLGDGTTTYRKVPVQVSGLSGVTTIAGGYDHTIALKSDGTVWTWGNNDYGQLGDGTTTRRTTPVQASDLSSVTAIAGGYGHTIALKSDGTVWTWGHNNYCQLGDESDADRTTPVRIGTLKPAIPTVATTSATNVTFNSAILNGSVNANGASTTAWFKYGSTSGEYSYSTTTETVSGMNDMAISIDINGLSSDTTYYYRIVAQNSEGTSYGDEKSFTTLAEWTSPMTLNQIAGGTWHSIALKSDGTVWTWGSNKYGALGDGTYDNRYIPEQVIGLSNAIAIAGGGYHTIALKSDGTVWTWGYNNSGQLGDGTTTNSNTPVQVKNSDDTFLNDVTAVAGGGGIESGVEYGGYTIVLKSDGTVWSWGNNEHGQLGDGTTADRTTPVQISNLRYITAIASGKHHSLALKSDGTVWAWGDNWRGELGDGSTSRESHVPVEVVGLSGVTAIACGYFHSVALKSDGTICAWGDNDSGQLGNGTRDDSATPAQVSGLNGVTAIASGRSHTIALKSDGTVWAWGYNIYGQLGFWTLSSSITTPSQVSDLSDVAAVTSGANHTIALKSDGTVWAWGNNEHGQLGDGTTYNSYYPVQVSGINLYVTTTTPTPTATTTSTPISLPTPTPIPSPSLSTECIVSGYVANQNNNLLEDVTITITGIDFSDRTNSDEDGYYLFNRLIAGEYTLTYEKEGYVIKTVEISLIEGEEKYLAVTVLIKQMQNGRISGYVYNMKGYPIESAKIRLKKANSKVLKKTFSDEDGFFEFADLDTDTYIITALKSGYKMVKQTLTLEEGEDVDIEIEMKKTARKIK